MNMQTFGATFFLANIPHNFLNRASLFTSRILSLLLLVSVMSACDFIKKGSSASPVTGNPGVNVSLASEFADGPTDNSHRMLRAVKQIQYCAPNVACTQTPKDYITYDYADGLGLLPAGFLETAVEETVGTLGLEITSQRQYYYIDSSGDLILDRLDKVAVRVNGNFHTLHDYFYDDEDDGDFTALAQPRPKLRKEYICDINLPVVPGVTTETCDRSNADEVITYIYNQNGYLYRKEFDVNNDTKIEHQKIYYYDNNVLSRVDTDNFYNGDVDERFEYEFDAELGLRVFIDKNYLVKPTGTDVASSYKIGYQENTIATASQTIFPFSFYIASSDQIIVTLNDTILVETNDYTVTPILVPPFGGNVTLNIGAADGDEIVLSGYDNITSKECYFNKSTPNECTNNSKENFHWLFTWELGDCWAGGLDDIDPEARSIDYLCKQGG